MDINSQVWIDMIRKEYLQDFIKRGGAAVKFLISDKETGQDILQEKLRNMAKEENYFFTFIDAVSTKIHMIQEIFHKVACEVDWDALAYHFITQVFKENGYDLPEKREDLNLQKIASINEREERFLQRDVQVWLEKKIYRDFEMSQEFRIAMIKLCLSQLDTPGGNSMSDTIKEWLRGELRLISALKDALIFQKIARHNARHMLFSLAHWLKLNGLNGFILALDISRYMMISPRPRNPENGFFYSIPAVLDAYEVLRQFIDGTDEMESCLVVVFSTKDFLTDEKRGLNRYEALKFRIFDDVHDRSIQNPLTSLVRVTVKAPSLPLGSTGGDDYERGTRN